MQRGRQVNAGDALFALENAREKHARDEAAQRLAQARSTLEDVKKGRRPTEIASLEAQLSQARAELDFSQKEYQREEGLVAGGAATSNALGALAPLLNTALQNDFKGPLAFLANTNGPIDLRVHALCNPEAVTQYNIVPGLLGVVLTMTMVLITAMAITRERERGTMENLLSMPTRPAEVLAGKIIP